MTDIVENPKSIRLRQGDGRQEVQNRSAQPSAGGGKSAAELVRQSNRWRDNYNPVRGLFIARAISILETADRGDFAELQLVMRKVERRHFHDRRVLLYHEKERQKMQRQMSQDPYLDTAG
jgi:hypothetical protein